jgi:hypothetical protein
MSYPFSRYAQFILQLKLWLSQLTLFFDIASPRRQITG